MCLKKYFSICLVALFSLGFLYSQELPRNAIKTDLLGICWGDVSLEYEHQTWEKVALVGGVGVPYSGVYASNLRQTPFSFGTSRGIGFYGGAKVYLVSKGNLQGFAIRPQISYAYNQSKQMVGELITNPAYDEARRQKVGFQANFSYQWIISSRIVLEPMTGVEFGTEKLQARKSGQQWESPGSNQWEWDLNLPLAVRIGLAF